MKKDEMEMPKIQVVFYNARLSKATK